MGKKRGAYLAAMAWSFAELGGITIMIGVVLDMVADELGKEVGIYMELLGNKDVVLIKLVDAVDWVNEGNNILGCKGNLGLNFSVDELAVVSKNEVTAYKAESATGIIVVYNWETGGLMLDNKCANLIASSMSLIFVTLM